MKTVFLRWWLFIVLISVCCVFGYNLGVFKQIFLKEILIFVILFIFYFCPQQFGVGGIHGKQAIKEILKLIII